MKRMVLFAIASTLIVWAPAGRAAASSPSDSAQTEPVANEPGVKSGNSFSLEEAVELALFQNPDLTAIRREMGLSRARVLSDYSLAAHRAARE